MRCTVVDKSPLAQSFFSKYCSDRYILPSSSNDPERFIRCIWELTKSRDYEVLLPIGWHANYYASKYRTILEKHTAIPVAPYESMRVAANKDLTMEFAKSVGVDVPATYQANNMEDIEEICAHAAFPLVIKGSVSAGNVRYARNASELKRYFLEMADVRPIVQEYIEGYGCGFFALYDSGKCVARFMHRRIREFPPSGGPSVAARADYSAELMQQGMKILDALNWHGVAMVEFKKDRKDGKYKLMEINPKFWGSLELAIAAGVDFPYLAYLTAKGQSFDPVFKYNRDVMFRWPFPGDLMYALSQHRLRGFIRDFTSGEYTDDVYLNDLGPLPIQIIGTIKSIRQGLNAS